MICAIIVTGDIGSLWASKEVQYVHQSYLGRYLIGPSSILGCLYCPIVDLVDRNRYLQVASDLDYRWIKVVFGSPGIYNIRHEP